MEEDLDPMGLTGMVADLADDTRETRREMQHIARENVETRNLLQRLSQHVQHLTRHTIAIHRNQAEQQEQLQQLGQQFTAAERERNAGALLARINRVDLDNARYRLPRRLRNCDNTSVLLQILYGWLSCQGDLPQGWIPVSSIMQRSHPRDSEQTFRLEFPSQADLGYMLNWNGNQGLNMDVNMVRLSRADVEPVATARDRLVRDLESRGWVVDLPSRTNEDLHVYWRDRNGALQRAWCKYRGAQRGWEEHAEAFRQGNFRDGPRVDRQRGPFAQVVKKMYTVPDAVHEKLRQVSSGVVFPDPSPTRPRVGEPPIAREAQRPGSQLEALEVSGVPEVLPIVRTYADRGPGRGQGGRFLTGGTGRREEGPKRVRSPTPLTLHDSGDEEEQEGGLPLRQQV